MNEVAKKENPTLLISRMQGQFAKVLPKIVTPERFCRVVLTAINKNPALGDALTDPKCQPSVLSAFMRCAEMGLEPDGRRAAINCYRKKSGGYDVTLIPMYQGLAELAMRSGVISTIHAEKVCDKDVFEWDIGRIIKHVPYWKVDRGEAYLFYAHIVFKDGMVKDEVMTRSEIDAVRDLSSGYQYAKRTGGDCPWISHYEEMAKKTVFRRCSKWLPLSPELRSAIEADDEDYSESAAELHHAANDKFAQTVGVADPQPDSPIDVDAVPEEAATEMQGEDAAPDSLFGGKTATGSDSLHGTAAALL